MHNLENDKSAYFIFAIILTNLGQRNIQVLESDMLNRMATLDL